MYEGERRKKRDVPVANGRELNKRQEMVRWTVFAHAEEPGTRGTILVGSGE